MNELWKVCLLMGIMNRFSSGVTNKVGNKVLNIEEIKEKVFCQQLKKK